MTPNELLSPLSQLQAVCENATVSLFVMDGRQHCVYMNRAAERLTGYALSDVQGGPLHNFVHHTHPDGRPFPIEDCPIDQVAPQNDQEQGETDFVHKDGHFFPVAFTASPVRRDDRVIGTVIEVRDISAERQRSAEAAAMRELAELILGEVRLEAVVQSVTDTATRLTGAQFGAFFYNTVNRDGDALTLYALSGVPREAFSRFPMPRATPLFKPTFVGEQTVCVEDVLADSRFGQWAPYHGMPAGHLPVRSYLATPVLSDRGEVLGGLFFGHELTGRFTQDHVRLVESLAAQAAIGVSRAMLFQAAETARDRAEAEAREKERLYQEASRASQMKDLFLATVSHELRTPLTSILGWSDMLASGRLTPEMARNAVATIARSARAQAQIVEDLLDVSRIVSGKLQLNMRTVDPVEVTTAAVEAVRPAALAKDIRLELHIGQDGAHISADADRLQQVVWNLLTNAVKFTGRGGRIDIRVGRVGSHAQVEVSDNGRGIEAEFLPRLFDRFSQLDSSSTREEGGLGLGLAIVRQLVEMHGGTVRASSEGAQKGSTFVVQIPIAAVRTDSTADSPRLASNVAAEAADAELPDLHGVRVLIVEDDADSRDLLAEVVRSRGADVVAAPSAMAGLTAVDEFLPTVVVSDIGMPGEDGYAFIRAMRERESAAGRAPVPAIALTAYAQVADRMRALASGFQMHVAKPVHPAELLAILDSLRSWRTGVA